MTLDRRHIEALVMRVQNDFLKAPELRLRISEAQRRYELDSVGCEAILGVLLDARVLTRTPDGAYARFFPRRRTAPVEAAAAA